METLYSLFKAVLSTLPAAIGAFVSLRFMPETLATRDRVVSVICGYAVGAYVGQGAVEYLNISQDGHVGKAIVFSVALFGLSVVGHAMQEIQPALKALIDRIQGSK